MLIGNTLPQISATQAANVAATQSAALSAAAASASRPLTANAVNAAAAASAYSPQLPQQQRRAQAEQSLAPAASNSAGRPAILPDPEFWRVPDRQVKVETPPPQVRATVETVQKTTAYVAQAVAQSLPETKEEPELPQQATPGARKPTALFGKKPGVSDTTGFGAYDVASRRSTEISFPNTLEAFA